MPDIGKQVEARFGVLPNFFRLSPETPGITEKLWGFAQAAYLDNPLPSVFKERLFVHLSRFCAVRYCIARHAGFLLGLGHPSGDAQARVQSVGEVVKLLRRPFPRGHDLATEHPQTTKARPIHLTFRNLDEALFQRSLTRQPRKTAASAECSKYFIALKSSISPGPLGRHPSRSRVSALETGTS